MEWPSAHEIHHKIHKLRTQLLCADEAETLEGKRKQYMLLAITSLEQAQAFLALALAPDETE